MKNKYLCLLAIFLVILLTGIKGYSQNNNIEINPSNLDLGEWPIGAWQQPAQFYLTNSGFGDLEVYSSELQDPDNTFVLHNIDIPYTIAPFADTAVIGISITNETISEGVYSAIYMASCDDGNSISSANVMVSMYSPSLGDVFENAIEISLPYSEQNANTAFPIRTNYQLLADSENGNDLVYKFELSEDVIIDIQLSNASSSSILALYKDDFMGDNGPSYDNAIEFSLTDSLEIPLFHGIYYLIVSSQEENSDFYFDLEITAELMPSPEAAFNPIPENNANNVRNIGATLSFQLSEFAHDYQILIGNTNPPTDVIVSWTLAEDYNSVPIGFELEPDQTYYWQVNSKNNNGIGYGEIWTFSTTNTPPTDLTATLVEINPFEYNVELNWTQPAKALLVYNLYRNGVLIGTIQEGISTYTDENVSPNMNPCHEYILEGVWDQGVSVLSIPATACIPENGNITGTLTDIETGELISGKATIDLISETTGMSYTLESYDDGDYSVYVESDIYSMQISHPNYLTELTTSVEVNLHQTTTQNFQLTPYPFEVDTVFAEIINGTTALIEWIPDSTFIDRIVSYEVYRKSCDEKSDWELIAETSELTYYDEEWNTLELEEYKYAIKAKYNLYTSDYKESNCNYTENFVTVNIEVTTSTGDSPETSNVLFTHISNQLVYEVDMDATGMYTIDPFEKGTYNIDVELYGYLSLAYEDILIDSDTTFNFQLEEQKKQIKDLYVTPTGIATWDSEYPLQSFDLIADFEDGFPEEWSIVNNGNTEDSWALVNDPNFNNSSYMMCSSLESDELTIMDEYLLSPVINAPMNMETFLEWDQNYQNASDADYFEVEVFDGYDWVQVYFQDTDDNAWPEVKHHSIDISEYANSYLQVRFHYVANSNAWYIGIDNIQIYNITGKSNKTFLFYKIWHDGIFVCDLDTTFYQFGTTMGIDELTPGETYLAEVAALSSTGLSSKSGYEWTYMPSGSFPGPNNFIGYNMAGSNDINLQWINPDPLDVIEINESYGDAHVAHYQNFDNGYGVIYDFSNYPDAIINAMDFRHSSWGNTGNWDYMVHIIDWDTKTSLAEIGPLQTTQNDNWEELVDLGEIITGGAQQIAVLIEPMGNIINNAYPRIDCDNAENSQSSVFGDLSNLEDMEASGLGNFLMDLWIQTNYNGKNISYRQIPSYEYIGTNVYRNNDLISFVAEPDTFFIDEDVPPGYYDYCIATVYSADDGEHSWTSTLEEVCINDIICPPDCNEPQDLAAEYLDWIGNELTWNPPVSKNDLLGYNAYSENEKINEELITDTYYLHICDNYYEKCYVVTAVYSDCESEPSNEACALPWGINEIEKSIEVYPNPAKSFVIVKSLRDIVSIEITNNLGQVIYTDKPIKTTHHISTSRLNTGVYYFKIETAAGIQIEKILISE